MSEWQVVIQRNARRYLERLPLNDRERILDALLILETGNFTGIDVKPLLGRPGWRLRVGDYRVLFLVDRENKVFVVTRIGPRGDVYKS